MIDEPLRLTQKYVQHGFLGVSVVDDDQIPALSIGAGWGPSARFGNFQKGFTVYFFSLFKSSDAAALDNDFE